MDRFSLRDALYAERLAATLRDSSAFHAAKKITDNSELDSYTARRAVAIRECLSGSEADVQWAIEDVRKFWCGLPQDRKTARAISILVMQAKRLLLCDGREMILQVDTDDPGREVLRWRFVSLALPPSILIAAATPRDMSPAAAVRLLHPSMAPDQPVAHQHVHHAAMLSFEDLWSALRLQSFLDPEAFWGGLRTDRAICPGLHDGTCIAGRREEERALGERYPFARAKHMLEWGAMLRQAFVAGGLLARHAVHTAELRVCSRCAVALSEIRQLIAGTTCTYREAARPYPWPDETARLRRDQRCAEDPHKKRSSLTSESDFIARQAMTERHALARAFERVAPLADESADELYEQVLVQYLRVKAALFGLLVHPPGERGLANFLDHFLQIKVYAPSADAIVPAPPDEPGLVVGATEYRVAPDAWFKVLRRSEIERRKGRTSTRRSEAGWLIHFKRQSPAKRVPLHIEAVKTMEAEADQIARFLDAQPKQLTQLRGIDICGVEEKQPCWVVADTLRRLRNRSRHVAGRNPHLRLQPLRLTLHAGEDFRWLTSGVRAVAEPFVWSLIQRGDRIGHGIAITLDPKKWWSQKSRDVVRVKRFDRLLDLAFLADYVDRPTRDQREWLRAEITRIVQSMKLEPVLAQPPSVAIDVDVVDTAKRLWRALGTPTTRRLMATSKFAAESASRHEQWIYAYLWTRRLHVLGDEEIPMRLDPDRGDLLVDADFNERDLLVEARKKLIREVARWQVCIESSPSSNLIVGSLESMLAQDFLHRRPTSPAEQKGEETLMWTISTDDPITFSTTLADEYAYAWAGMVLRKDKPYDPAYARALLDEAAATSMRTRFTIPADEDERRDNRRGRDRTRRG